MVVNRSKEVVEKLLKNTGISIDGDQEWDIQVHNPKFYQKVLAGGSLALGESYVAGWWDCKALDKFFNKIIAARLDKKVKGSAKLLWSLVKAKAMNLQSKSRAYEIGKRHYDVGNDLYKNMLDKRMTYSCGYWKDAHTLNQAQEAKLDLICKKIGLKPGMTVLDIGCGWGSFAKFAAQKYKAKVVGITVSKEQLKLARQICKGLPVELRLEDYRSTTGQFDRVVSVGMIEHVGFKNYSEFMRVAHRCLKPKGLFLLHTIGSNVSSTFGDPWSDKYIFPNGMLPSIKQIARATEGLFVMEDWHNFGPYYDKTLMQWHDNFVKNWDKIKENYGAHFYRMWRYYLLSFAGAFRARKNQLWQIVMSKNGVEGGYQSLR